MRKIWIFRLIAAGVPSLLGIILIAYMLYQREQLVVEDGTVKLQAAPLYVQEEGFEKTGHKYLFDAELGWRNIPDWSAQTFGKPLNTNSHHLRDREYGFESPAGSRRILVLGDSFAWGYGVGDSDIFTEVLEQRLTAQNWEVLNTGVSGWGTDQQYLYFKSEGKKYSPDIVVVAFYLGNDPGNCTNSLQYGLSKPVFVDLDLTLKNVPVPKPTAAKPKFRSNADKHLLVVRILEALADECDQIGAKLVVMKFGVFQFPEKQVVQLANADFESKLERIRSRLSYLDLDEGFAEYGFSKLQLTEGVDDGHWNPFGHRMTAEILQDFLAGAGLL